MIGSMKPNDAYTQLLLIVCMLFLGHPSALSQNSATNSTSSKKPDVNTSRSGDASQDIKIPASSAPASTSSNKDPDNTDELPPCPSLEEYRSVSVENVYVGTRPSIAPQGTQTESSTQSTEVRLGDVLTLEFSNLAPLLTRAKCTNPNKRVLLFLDGRPVRDATPFPPTDPGQNELRFVLRRTENSRDFWTYLLGSPSWSPRPVDVSAGLEDEYPVRSNARIQLQVLPHGWLFFWAIIFAGLIASFLLLAVYSNLLRDSGAEPQAGGRKPFSLARSQAAWWFFLVLASYLFIGIVTGDFSTSITSTVLGLLGISAATVVGSAIIDSGRADADNHAKKAAPKQSANSTSNTGRTIYMDLLSEGGAGVSFHRFQIVAWTLILGIIFAVQVYRGLAMPTFDNTLLALLGISAGTFLGIKTQEKS